MPVSFSMNSSISVFGFIYVLNVLTVSLFCILIAPISIISSNSGSRPVVSRSITYSHLIDLLCFFFVTPCLFFIRTAKVSPISMIASKRIYFANSTMIPKTTKGLMQILTLHNPGLD